MDRIADHWLWGTVAEIVPTCAPDEVEAGRQECLPHVEEEQPGVVTSVEAAEALEVPTSEVPTPEVPEVDKEPEVEQPALSKFAEAVNLHRLGRREEALALYAVIPESDPSYPDALVNRIALTAGNDASKLREYGEQLFKLRRTSRPALEALMQSAMATADYKAAAQHGIRLVKQAAESYEAWFNLGLCYHQTSHFEEAAQAYSEAIKLRPDGMQARANLGVLLQAHGDIPGARREFERVLQLAPADSRTKWNLALIHEKEGQIVQAEKIYLRLIREEFQVYTVAFRLGRLRLKRKNYLGAVEAFERCLLERPDDAAAEMNLILALRVSGDPGDRDNPPGETRLSELLHKHADTLEGLGLQASWAVEGNDWKRASEMEAKLSGMGENTAILSYNIGVLQQRDNLLTEAIQSYERAVAQEPGFAEAHLNRGHALMRAGQTDEARAAWKDALEGKPAIAASYFKGPAFSETAV